MTHLSKIPRGAIVTTPNGYAKYISTYLDLNDNDAREPEGKYALVIHYVNQTIDSNLCYHTVLADNKTGWIVVYKASEIGTEYSGITDE